MYSDSFYAIFFLFAFNKILLRYVVGKGYFTNIIGCVVKTDFSMYYFLFNIFFSFVYVLFSNIFSFLLLSVAFLSSSPSLCNLIWLLLPLLPSNLVKKKIIVKTIVQYSVQFDHVNIKSERKITKTNNLSRQIKLICNFLIKVFRIISEAVWIVTKNQKMLNKVFFTLAVSNFPVFFSNISNGL